MALGDGNRPDNNLRADIRDTLSLFCNCVVGQSMHRISIWAQLVCFLSQCSLPVFAAGYEEPPANAATGTNVSASDNTVLDERLHHLRIGSEREWTEFPEQAEGDALEVSFTAPTNMSEQSLRLRHRDIKQTWKLSLNGRELGTLPIDENDMVTVWAIPPQTLRTGKNVLRVASTGKAADDVLIGDVRLLARPRQAALSEATLEVTVTDAETQSQIPCRITVVDANESLMSFGMASDSRLAIRPGVIYTSDGRAHAGIPAGRYTVYAGRGFEYSLDSTRIEIQPGARTAVRLSIRREVPTPSLVSCDTHTHTLTHSGHGDATLAERMVTLAGEGIELPIATDHNVNIDYEPAAIAAGVRKYFTPVIGSEVTTPKLGHFNVFPIARGTPSIDHTGKDWETVFRRIRETPSVEVIVLNHARDLHGGFRPFGPKQHIGPAGENIDGWKLEANAMEVINSGATQTDPLQLPRDWMGLLNRGLRITPIGSSDSHDVARHFVGQGRTYVRCDDKEPGQIDVAAACRSLCEGRVSVSFGLLTELTVEDRYGPGDLAKIDGELDVHVRVLGPKWTTANHVALYMNGVAVREAVIATPNPQNPNAIKWEGHWSLPQPKHDVHLTAIATGPGVRGLYWPTPKPYQPTSPDWRSSVVGLTGAVWVDTDGSGEFNSAHDYAARIVNKSQKQIPAILESLAEYDEAVAIQAASLMRAQGVDLLAPEIGQALANSAPGVRRGFDQYITAWKQSLAARAAH